MWRLSVLALAVVLAASAAWADLVHLRDGTTLSGSVRRTPSGWTVTDDNGKVTEVADSQVRAVEKVGNLTKAEIADSKLAALRRLADGMSDLPAIIDRFQKFVDEHKDTPAGKQAAADLAIWQDRQVKGLTKVGSRWVSAEEQGTILRKIVAAIDEARGHLRANRVREAEAVVDRILADDPANASAQYLKGVILYGQGKVILARNAFDAVREAIPDHAPTLNNLGVLNYRQGQFAGAMTFYDLAMAAAPESKEILNNVAEALGAMPAEHRRSTQAQRALKRFEEQDTVLQQKLAPTGWYRWGGTWINQQQADQIKQAEQDIRTRLEALAQDYEKIRTRLANIEREITANNRTIDRINAERWMTDGQGRLYQRALPPEYDRLVRDNELLALERRDLETKLGTFKNKAAAIEAQKPMPKFTGTQQMIGPEGTPLAVAPPEKTAANPPREEPPPVPKVEPATLPAGKLLGY